MPKNDLTDSELLILGLVAEMPRHGYELEGIIEDRGMREWTRIGFSSIYYTLSKLENRALLAAEGQSSPRARKRYQLTDQGQKVLIENTYSALSTLQPSYPSMLLGLIHLNTLSRDQTLDALRLRQAGLVEEIKRLELIHFDQQPLPDHVDLVFDYSIDQLKAEADWIEKTLSYLETKTWLE